MPLAIWAVLLGLGGLAVAAVGVVFLVPTSRFAVSATRSAEGTIVGHDREETQEAVYYYPRVAFTVDGVEWVIRGKIGHIRPRPRVGARRRVYFPPGDPEAASMDRFAGVWVSLGLIFLGFALATGAVWTWIQD
jgi:hypothetical protein